MTEYGITRYKSINPSWTLSITLGILIICILMTTACNSGWHPLLETQSQSNLTGSTPQATQTKSTPKTEIIFRIETPPNTPPDESIYLTLLDEVTGLALNAESHEMEIDEETSMDQPGMYTIKLPFEIGSVIKYRYERAAGTSRVLEHIASGEPVRYRLYVVNGPGEVEDMVSRWTDTEYIYPSGRVLGQAIEPETHKPIPGLFITAGGAQTFTAGDGSFILEGLPPGIHNLVGYAIDGAYETFQQGAQVAADSTTPATIELPRARLVNVQFSVTLPTDTPPLVPVRLAGNLFQLGNTFGTLDGGVSVIPERMPTLSHVTENQYALTLSLPAGADIRYKYTLGDGFWNAEHDQTGEFKLRQLIVPQEDAEITDAVETWSAGSAKPLALDVSVPVNTPVTDSIYIQFAPIIGWTNPIPMWNFGNNRWAYILYSPVNLPGAFSYRYCRNAQCGTADDVLTAGENGPGRPVDLSTLPTTIKDNVSAWVGMDVDISAPSSESMPVNVRSENFYRAIEYTSDYHPSWYGFFANSVEEIRTIKANTLILSPTWSMVQTTPPVLEPVPAKDAIWQEIIQNATVATDAGLKVMLYPLPKLPGSVEEWWGSVAHDFPFWSIWFERVEGFLVHHAILAEESGASALIIGGDWVTPSLPDGKLPDGSPSEVPVDSEKRWRSILSKVKKHFKGDIFWASQLTVQDQSINVPAFINAVDGIYGLVDDTTYQELFSSQADASQGNGTNLDVAAQPVIVSTNKPIILAAAIGATSLDEQSTMYSSLYKFVNAREWIGGVSSRGYYPPAALQDDTTSVHGKPAQPVLQYWYAGFSGVPQ